jgi:hypothetical protein
LGVDEFGLQVIEIRLIQGKTALERSIGDTALALEEREHLREYVIKRHGLVLGVARTPLSAFPACFYTLLS